MGRGRRQVPFLTHGAGTLEKTDLFSGTAVRLYRLDLWLGAATRNALAEPDLDLACYRRFSDAEDAWRAVAAACRHYVLKLRLAVGLVRHPARRPSASNLSSSVL